MLRDEDGVSIIGAVLGFPFGGFAGAGLSALAGPFCPCMCPLFTGLGAAGGAVVGGIGGSLIDLFGGVFGGIGRAVYSIGRCFSSFSGK
jgi:hypothetical protein